MSANKFPRVDLKSSELVDYDYIESYATHYMSYSRKCKYRADHEQLSTQICGAVLMSVSWP